MDGFVTNTSIIWLHNRIYRRHKAWSSWLHNQNTKHCQNIFTLHNFNNAQLQQCTTSTEHVYLQIDNRSTVSDLLSQPARLWEGLILILYSSFILFTNSSHYLACQTLGRVDFGYGVIIFIDYLISMFCIAVVNISWNYMW